MGATILRTKKIRLTIVFIVLLLITYGSVAITKFDWTQGLLALPSTVYWMAVNLIPSAEAFGNLSTVLEKLAETIILSILATTTAAFCALFCAMLGSRTTQMNAWLGFIVRMLASFFRNVPVVAWALVLVISFGHHVITGYFALFFSTFGLLVRMFIDTIDEASSDGVEALNGVGATYLQMVFKGVLPETLPQLLSWIFYMIETNIRSATLVGLLTGTGIGYLFDFYYKQLNYEMLGLITVVIVVVVFLIEWMSNRVRRIIS